MGKRKNTEIAKEVVKQIKLDVTPQFHPGPQAEADMKAAKTKQALDALAQMATTVKKKVLASKNMMCKIDPDKLREIVNFTPDITTRQDITRLLTAITQKLAVVEYTPDLEADMVKACQQLTNLVDKTASKRESAVDAIQEFVFVLKQLTAIVQGKKNKETPETEKVSMWRTAATATILATGVTLYSGWQVGRIASQYNDVIAAATCNPLGAWIPPCWWIYLCLFFRHTRFDTAFFAEGMVRIVQAISRTIMDKIKKVWSTAGKSTMARVLSNPSAVALLTMAANMLSSPIVAAMANAACAFFSKSAANISDTPTRLKERLVTAEMVEKLVDGIGSGLVYLEELYPPITAAIANLAASIVAYSPVSVASLVQSTVLVDAQSRIAVLDYDLLDDITVNMSVNTMFGTEIARDTAAMVIAKPVGGIFSKIATFVGTSGTTAYHKFDSAETKLKNSISTLPHNANVTPKDMMQLTKDKDPLMLMAALFEGHRDTVAAAEYMNNIAPSAIVSEMA